MDLIGKLSFNDSLYPFYGEIYQQNINGGGISLKKFSVSDTELAKNIKLEQNPKIYFYSKSEAIQRAEDFDDIYSIKNPVVDIYLGTEHYVAPIAGVFQPRELFESYNFGYEIKESNTTVSLSEGTFDNAYNLNIDSNKLISIFFTEDKEKFISVEVKGNVRSPGVFNVSPGITINEIYDVVGGFLESADTEAIILQRELLKDKERILVDSSKKLLNDLLIQNITKENNAITIENINSLLLLAEQIDVTGRQSGEFMPNSVDSLNTIIQDGDVLTVPSKTNSISVIGEVKNQITFSYRNNWNLEQYINAAGGFSDYADKGNLFIIRKNGIALDVSRNFFSKQNYIMPGDTIVIPRDYSQNESIQYIENITRIISNIAFSAASLNVLRN